MKKLKKAGLKVACLLFGLCTFTACYGPAPYPDEPFPAQEEQSTKAADADADEEQPAQKEWQRQALNSTAAFSTGSAAR